MTIKSILIEAPEHKQAIAGLINESFGGDGRKTRTVYKLRLGIAPIQPLSLVAVDDHGTVIGALRFWPVRLPDGSSQPLLGPLAVNPSMRGRGIGRALIDAGLNRARAIGYQGVLIVGDPGYYTPYGFGVDVVRGLNLPGDVAPLTFMGLEFESGFFAKQKGDVRREFADQPYEEYGISDALPRQALRNVTDEEKQDFFHNGVTVLRNIIPQRWLDYLAPAIEKAMTNPGKNAEELGGKDGKGRFFGDLELWKERDEFRRFAYESPAATIAGQIMGARQINFFYDQLLVKEPGSGARTPWHQDQPYWAVSGRQVCSIWMPFDSVAEDVAVEYIKGSHNWQEFSAYHFIDNTPYENSKLPMLPDIEANRSDYDIMRWQMEPGDCLIFQAMIIHGAPANQTQNRRRALATRWCGDDARYCVRQGEVAIPTEDPGLTHGQRLDSATFPRVWQLT